MQDQKEVNVHRTSLFFFLNILFKKSKKLISRISNHLYQCSSDDEQSLQLTEISAVAHIRTRPGPSSPEPLADARGEDDNKRVGVRKTQSRRYFILKDSFHDRIMFSFR